MVKSTDKPSFVVSTSDDSRSQEIAFDAILLGPASASSPEMEVFLVRLRSKRKGKHALESLVNDTRKYKHREWLIHHILNTCYWVELYAKEDKDHYQQLRERDRAFQRNVERYKKQMIALANSLDEDRTAFDTIITRAAIRSGIGLARRPKGVPVRWPDDGVAGGYVALDEQGNPKLFKLGPFKFARADVSPRRSLRSSFALRWLLISMANTIKRVGSPTRGKGAWLHRTAHGCLHFSEAIDVGRTKLPSTHTMLVFNLVLLFRLCSIYQEQEFPGGWHNAEPMPKTGKPHWGLATELANAILGKSISAEAATDAVKKLIRRNKNIGLGTWPNEKYASGTYPAVRGAVPAGTSAKL